MQPPRVGEGEGVDGTLDEEFGAVVGVVLLADLPPPPPHPTAKASTAAPPNSVIAVLAPYFIKRPVPMSGQFVYTRVPFIVVASPRCVDVFGDNPAVSPLSARTLRRKRPNPTAICDNSPGRSALAV